MSWVSTGVEPACPLLASWTGGLVWAGGEDASLGRRSFDEVDSQWMLSGQLMGNYPDKYVRPLPSSGPSSRIWTFRVSSNSLVDCSL